VSEKPNRMVIRLKHSLAADEEIHAMLPDTLEEADEAPARSELEHEGEGAEEK